MIDHVTNAAIAVTDHDLDGFEDYNDREIDDNRPATNLLVMFKALEFTKPVGFWCNFELILPPMFNDHTQKPKHPNPIELSSAETNAQEPIELTNYTIVEKTMQVTPMDEETFAAFTNTCGFFQEGEVLCSR